MFCGRIYVVYKKIIHILLGEKYNERKRDMSYGKTKNRILVPVFGVHVALA